MAHGGDDRKDNWTEEARLKAMMAAQTRANDLERMLDHQLAMVRTLQEQCNKEMLSTDGASGKFADKQVVSKMTAITNMLHQAAKVKIDLAKAYEKLDAVMSPEKRLDAMVKYILALPTEILTTTIQALAAGREHNLKVKYNKQGVQKNTAVDRIVSALRQGGSDEQPE